MKFKAIQTVFNHSINIKIEICYSAFRCSWYISHSISLKRSNIEFAQ